jgi:ubiquitin C-terminal hydrolase
MFFPTFVLQTKKYEVSQCGLMNPLNLCYMIAVMQGLLSVQQLNFYFYKKQYVEGTDNKKRPLHNQLHKFVKQLI